VARFRYLSAVQQARLLYQLSSLQYVRAHLAKLYHGRYLQRIFLPTVTPHGSSAAVYCLDNRGYGCLRAQGAEPRGRFRASEQVEREWLFLRHTLACNDVLIAAHQVARTVAGLHLTRFFTEHELKQKGLSVADGDKELPVEPDGWVDFLDGRVCIAIEVDRGTEDRDAFRKKIRGYIRFIDGPYQQAFGTESLTVAVITTAGDSRLPQLVAWSEAELVEQGARDLSELFLFAALDPAAVSATDLFCTPRFQALFDASDASLLPSMDQG
jgi:hypothetical protein